MSRMTSTMFASLCLFAAALATAAGEPTAGKNLRKIDFDSCGRPVYPRADITAGHQGTVTLQFLVNEDGTVADSRVRRSSGFASLDEAAQTALAQCRFQPADNGTREQSWVPVQYVWTLT